MDNRSIRRRGDIGVERIFDKNNFDKKHKSPQQDVKQTPKKNNPENFILKHIILSTEGQREYWKHMKDGTLYVQGIFNKETADFSF